MDKLKKGMVFAVLALQVMVPIAVLAQQAGDEPIVDDFCGVIDLIGRITNILLVALIVLAVIFIIMAAFKYLTAGGDSEKVGAANKQILYAAIAVAVGLLATAVPSVVSSIIGGDVGQCDEVGVGALNQ